MERYRGKAGRTRADEADVTAIDTDSRARAVALLAAAAALLAAVAVASNELGSFGGDNAEYVLLAKAIREGHGYVATWVPGEHPPHTLYPPVLPLLLVPFVGDAPRAFLGAHLLLAAAGATAVFLTVRLFVRMGLPPLAAGAAALAPALTGSWLRCAADVLSELPFLAFAMGAFVLAEPPEGRAPTSKPLFGAVACAAAAFLTRTAGIAFAAAVLWRLVRPAPGGRRSFAAASALAAVCGAWFLYGKLAGESEATYVGVLQSGAGLGESPLLPRMWANLTEVYLPDVPSYLFPFPGPAQTAIAWIAWPLAVVGAVSEFLRTRRVGTFALGSVGYLTLLCAWTHRDPRFALPLAPFLGGYAALGAAVLAAWRREPDGQASPQERKGSKLATRVATALALVFVAATATRYFTRTLPRATRPTPPLAGLPAGLPAHDVAGFTESWGWDDAQFAANSPAVHAYLSITDAMRADTQLPPGPVLASNPRVAALLCARPAVAARAHAAAEATIGIVHREKVALVLVDAFDDSGARALRLWRTSPRTRASLVYRLGPVELLAPSPPPAPR